jgi:hypothetical protein
MLIFWDMCHEWADRKSARFEVFDIVDRFANENKKEQATKKSLITTFFSHPFLLCLLALRTTSAT